MKAFLLSTDQNNGCLLRDWWGDFMADVIYYEHGAQEAIEVDNPLDCAFNGMGPNWLRQRTGLPSRTYDMATTH